MDFDTSTQARSWLFNEASLAECREMAVAMSSDGKRVGGEARVRKIASGFHRSKARQNSAQKRELPSAMHSSYSSAYQQNHGMMQSGYSPLSLSSNEQETLVRFHAHQISMLVGPQAIHDGLRRNSIVLATAIMCFRRFYLSNSVVEFKPRRMAAASALLAAKLEEQRIDIRLLEHATSVIYQKVKSAPPACCKEFEPVTITEIESAERELLEGLNYELRCFHPYGAIRKLAYEVSSFLEEEVEEKSFSHEFDEKRDPCETSDRGMSSPKSVSHESPEMVYHKLREKAQIIAHNALLLSDVPFLFPPGKTAFAAVAIAVRSDAREDACEQGNHSPYLTSNMRKFLRLRFPQKAEQELRVFEHQVSRIIHILNQNTAMDLTSITGAHHKSYTREEVAAKAEELQLVMAKVPRLRELMKIGEAKKENLPSRKRKSFHQEPLFLNETDAFAIKVAKVTPI